MPAWAAVITTEPMPVMVSVAPLIVAGPVAVKVTVRPELAVADSLMGLTPYTTGEVGGAKVIVCVACVIVTLTAADVTVL